MKQPAMFLTLLAIFMIPSTILLAHCDTMNGPVVLAARKALETGNVSLVLIWVQKGDEKTIMDAFAKTRSVRKLSPEARDFADVYFFETVVRVHRAGEGVPYTGLKPPESQIDPGIHAADEALETKSDELLLHHLAKAVHDGIHHQFTTVVSKMSFMQDNVEAGREYVKAYVEFIHYTERLFQAASKPTEGHFHENEPAPQQLHNH